MIFDPQKFFIGLMDFFSILMPGALITWLLTDGVGPIALGERYTNLTGAEGWAAFLFASYLLGHLVFLLGAWLDELYDWARRYTLNTQIALLARHGRLLPWLARVLIWLVFNRERNLAVEVAGGIKRQALGPLHAQDAVNTFQWSKALLNASSPASLTVVQRFEADSKFFRSFTIVLLLLLFAWPWQDQWPPAGILIVLALLSLALWRYMEQRYKATNRAYWSVITLTAKDGILAFDKAALAPSSPSHAGGVVFRRRGCTAEYLLVEATDDPSQWVLPKGHVEAGELHNEAAVREVHEETGIWARVVLDMGDVSYAVNGTVISVRFLLMEAVGRGHRKDASRRHVWLPLQEAVAKASYTESRELLLRADTRGGTS